MCRSDGSMVDEFIAGVADTVELDLEYDNMLGAETAQIVSLVFPLAPTAFSSATLTREGVRDIYRLENMFLCPVGKESQRTHIICGSPI